MAIAVVAHTSGSLGSSGPTTPQITTTGATQIYIAVATFSTIDTASLTDSKGNTWTPLHGGQASNGAAPNVRLFYCDAPSVGVNHDFSYIQGSSYAAVAVVAVSDASGVPDVNVSGAAAQYGSPLTPAHNNEIVITATYVGGTHGTIDGGFTISDSEDTSGGNHIGVQFGYLIQTTATAFQPSWSAGTMIAQASFQAAGGASPPANTVAPAVTGTTTVGQTLSCSTGTWTDNGSPTFTYQWQRDTAGDLSFSNIGSATSSTYVLVSADYGNNVRCVVTDTDSNGATSANSNTVGPITAAIPVLVMSPPRPA